MPIRTIPAFIAYEADAGGTGVPLIAKGAQGSIFLAADDSSLTEATTTAYRLKDGIAFLPTSNIHGYVEGFKVEAPVASAGVWFVTGQVASYQGFLEGSRGPAGLPGTNAIPTDEAVGGLLATPGTNANSEALALINGVAARKPTSGARAVGQGEIVHNVLDYGAVGDGVADDTGAIQACLDLAKALGSVTVLVPPGTYKTTTYLRFYEGTVVNAHGATVRRQGNHYVGINGDRDQNYFGYNGHGNLIFNGGTYDGNGENNSVKAAIFSFGHGHDLTFNRVTFKDVIDSHHAEVNSSVRVYFMRCRFVGFRVGGGGHNEALQLDLASTGGFSAFGHYDFTPCKTVVIESCYFGPSGSPNTEAPPRGIGAHSSVIGAQSTDIVIKNNHFDGLTSYAIRTYNWNTVLIDSNVIKGRNGIRVESPAVLDGLGHNTVNTSGVQTGASEKGSVFKVTNNVVSVTDDTLPALYFYGEPTGIITDVLVSGNTVRGSSDNLSTLHVTNIRVLDNKFAMGVKTAVRLVDTKDWVMRGNLLEDAGEIGFLLTNNVSAGRCSDNYIVGSNRLGVDGTNYHIRSSGSGMNDNKFTGNTTARRSTGPDVKSAFSATGGTGYIRIGNNWKNSQKAGNDSVDDNSAGPIAVGEIS